MNGGAFGENFPYSNFHDLNMDWIIKIAKDFLDQYTHIQEVIANGEQSLQNLTTSGLQQLQEKATALENLLQQWYDTHSQDIANQLSAALLELTQWYDDHEGYLDNILQDNITAFDTHATEKAAQTIASIPSDYTTLFNNAFQYRGALAAGSYKNALCGTYAVDNTIVTGLPALTQRYGWLICIVPNSLYFLIDSSYTRNVWYDEAQLGWRQLYPTFYGPLGTGAYTLARTGTYSVNKEDVTGLPSDMTQNYGWLICIVPNNLYILIESNAEKTTWINEANTGWRKIYPSFYGPLGAGSYTLARPGIYSVDKETVTGLPAGMTQNYGWLMCIVPNSLYILIESNNDKTIWINEANTGWKQLYPDSFYKGGLANQPYTNAKTGVYAVSDQTTTGLPSEMTQHYGWLICLVPNNLYILVESNAEKTTWINEANTGWKLIYPPYKITGKKIAYAGDSIAESRYSGFASNGGGYPEIISKATRSTFVNASHGGATIARSSSEYNIIDMLDDLPADADIICLEGGINDYWLHVPMGTYSETDFTGTLDTSTFCGGLESLLRTAIDKWVGKPIVFVIVHKILNTAWTLNNAGYTFETMRANIINILDKYSIPYVDMYKEGGLNAYISALNNAYLNGGANTHPDGCHPDYEGYRRYYVPRLIEKFNEVTP